MRVSVETVSSTVENATTTLIPRCLYCDKQADVSVFVEDGEMFIQLTCEEHVPDNAIILWKRDES